METINDKNDHITQMLRLQKTENNDIFSASSAVKSTSTVLSGTKKSNKEIIKLVNQVGVSQVEDNEHTEKKKHIKKPSIKDDQVKIPTVFSASDLQQQEHISLSRLSQNDYLKRTSTDSVEKNNNMSQNKELLKQISNNSILPVKNINNDKTNIMKPPIKGI